MTIVDQDGRAMAAEDSIKGSFRGAIVEPLFVPCKGSICVVPLIWGVFVHSVQLEKPQRLKVSEMYLIQPLTVSSDGHNDLYLST